MRNTTTNSPNTTEGKTFKRGKWVKITVGKFAGQKRWYSAATRTKMSQSTRKNKPWVRAQLAKGGGTLTGQDTAMIHPSKIQDSPGTGTTVRLSQETATLLTSKTEGLTLEEATNYAVQYFCNNSLDGRLLKKPQEPEIVTLPST